VKLPDLVKNNAPSSRYLQVVDDPYASKLPDLLKENSLPPPSRNSTQATLSLRSNTPNK
jgi:hypothetical protein